MATKSGATVGQAVAGNLASGELDAFLLLFLYLNIYTYIIPPGLDTVGTTWLSTENMK